MMKCNVFLLIFYCVIFRSSGQSTTTCVCDLTSGSCDVNCCCDPDCQGSNNTATFSTCLNTGFTANTYQCVYNQIVFVNNLPTVTQVTQDSVFCLRRDGFSDSNFYTNPPCAQSATCFSQAQNVFAFEQIAGVSSVPTEFYRSGDPIYVVYPNGTFGFLSMPSTGISNICMDNSPVQYLQSATTSCTRFSTSSTTACTENPSLVCVNYTSAFKIAPSPRVFREAQNETNPFENPELILVTVSSAQNETLNQCVSLACTQVVSKISFTLEVNGTNGIRTASVSLTFSENSVTSVVQEHEIFFLNSPVDTPLLQRSGNPGYLVGRPIIARNASSEANLNPNVGVQMIQPTADGDCNHTQTAPVLFGKDTSTGCKFTYDISQVACTTWQEQIYMALDKNGIRQGTSLEVAMFGNVSTTNNNPSLWVAVETIQPSVSPSEGSGTSVCNNMVLGAQLQFLYAYNGAIANPQAQIISARYTFNSPSTLQTVCYGSTCSNMHQTEISFSVSFVDVSETPVSVLQAQPTFAARLPSDFFFPFKSGALSTMKRPWILITVVSIILCSNFI